MLARMSGDRRELSVAVSVEASVTSPLMTAPARRLLTVLGVLPDGIADEDLDTLLPAGALAAAAVLRQLGLAFDEAARLRTLAPIREHIAAGHPPAAADLDTAIGHYAQLAATTGKQVGRSHGAQAVTRLQADTGNITAMLGHAAAREQAAELADALDGLAEYWRLTGVTQPQLARQALDVITAHGTPTQQAKTFFALGILAYDRSDHDSARARYEQALPLYQQAGDVLGEAGCIKGLGDIALDRSDHDSARARYQQALPLYQQAGSVLGEANCIQRLGDIALARSDHDSARARYEQALPLYQQAGGLLGEAGCIQGLGDIDLARSDHDSALARYEQALPLYQQVGSVVGEANCIKSLGDIDRDRSDHDSARARYQQALPLYQQAGDVIGEAGCIQGLGDIDLARSDHDSALARYEQALPLYQAIPEPYSIGWTHIRLARLSPADKQRLGHWRAARQAWASIGREDLIESNAAEFEE
jgi:tetratricopeptide (TPR) repeat protein